MFAVYAKSCEKEYFARLDRFESVLIGSGFNATLNVEGSEAVHAQVTLGSQPLLECRAAKGMFCWPTNVQDAHAVESEAVRLPCATQIPLRAGARFKIGSLVFRVVLLSLQGTNAPGSYNPRDLVCIDAALEMTRNSDKCASDDWVGDSKSKFVFLRTRAQHASSNEIEVSIGRKAGQRRTDITVNAPQVSGKHCRVRWQRRCDNTRVFEVNDMNSRNGTTLVSSDQSEKRVLPQTWQVAPKASLIRLGKASVLLRPLEVLVEVEGSLSAMKEHASQYVSVITKPAEARVKLSAFDRIPSLMTDDAVTDALLRSDTPPDTLESLFGVTEVATKPLPKIAAKPSPKTDVVEVVEVVEASSFQSPRKSPRKQSQPTSSKSPPQQSMFNPRENLNASARTSAVKPEVEYVARTGLFGDCCLVLATESRRGDLLLVIYEQRGGTIVSDLETLGKWKGQQIILYDPEARKWRFTLDKSDTRKKPVEWVAACIKQGRTTTVTKSPKLKAEKKKLQVPSPKKSAAEVVELSFNVETDPNSPAKDQLGEKRPKPSDIFDAPPPWKRKKVLQSQRIDDEELCIEQPKLWRAHSALAQDTDFSESLSLQPFEEEWVDDDDLADASTLPGTSLIMRRESDHNLGTVIVVQHKEWTPRGRLAFFDLDGTLITRSARLKANADDSQIEYAHARVPEKLRRVSKSMSVVILSNQSGSSDSFVNAVQVLSRCLQIPFLALAAVEHDLYRKPELGMLRRVEKLLPNGFQLSPRSCFFVGDSAGRVCADGETNNGVITRNDTSCCDLLFAKNANLHFLEAERYFASKSTREQMAETRWYDGFPDEHDEDYDDDDYASLEEHVRSFSGLNPARLLESNDWRTLPDVIPDSTSQQCVIMCGMPGSGKSHFARLLVERRNFTRVCRDETASMSLVEQDLVTALKKGHSVVVDNTCPTESDRARWRQIARATCPDVDVLCVFLRTSVEVAWHLNCFRARRNGCRKLVPPEAFLGFRRRFESPVSTSGMPVITLETPVGPLHIAESEKSDFRLRSEMPKQLRNLIRVRAAPLRAQSYETVTSEERRKRAFYNKH